MNARRTERRIVAGAAAFAMVIVATVTVSHAQLQSPSIWPTYQHDLRHSGLSQFDTSANPGLLSWTFTTGGALLYSPAIAADGPIYPNSYDGNLYAINPNGTQKWVFAARGVGTPTIGADGTLYVSGSAPAAN